jgi:uncharacterized protein (TIRG00374 family)
LKKKQLILGAIVLIALVALYIWGHDRFHFDYAVFRAQLAQANWWMILAGLSCIYAGYLFRSMRWAMLLRHHMKVSPFTLLGTQVIGFTAIALIGRMADPVRPYLVSKKTGLSLSSQVAVYIVERLFDAGSFALIVSAALWLSSDAHGSASTGFIKRYLTLILTLCGALFLVLVRFYGEKIAQAAERLLSRISQKFAHSVAHKIRAFHSGLDIMRSFGDFFRVATTSLIMWGLITLAYLFTMHAFTASPELAGMTFPKAVGLMAAGGAASTLQLPIIGWFTQIAALEGSLIKFFHVAIEPATACAVILLVVTFLAVIPVGLVWARFERVSLRKVAEESEHDVEVLEEDEEATEQ